MSSCMGRLAYVSAWPSSVAVVALMNVAPGDCRREESGHGLLPRRGQGCARRHDDVGLVQAEEQVVLVETHYISMCKNGTG